MRLLGVLAVHSLGLITVLTACDGALDLGSNSADASDGSTRDDSGQLGGPSDGASDASAADAQSAADAVSTADAEAGGVKRVFVTRTLYTPNIGGIAGADFRCQAAANTVPLVGTFKAWLSDSATNAADRFVSDGPWVEVGTGALLFSSRADLRANPKALIGHDEFGVLAKARWWTGTLAGGLKAPANCRNWTTSSGSQRGLIGICGRDDEPVGADWTQWIEDSCAESYGLLCIED